MGCLLRFSPHPGQVVSCMRQQAIVSVLLLPCLLRFSPHPGQVVSCMRQQAIVSVLLLHCDILSPEKGTVQSLVCADSSEFFCCSEGVNLGLMSHHQQGRMDTEPQFKGGRQLNHGCFDFKGGNCKIKVFDSLFGNSLTLNSISTRDKKKNS